MPPDRDTDTGRYKETYPTDAFLSAISELETPTTQQIANEVGCSYDLAYRRLCDLESNGTIRKSTVGNSFLWAKSNS